MTRHTRIRTAAVAAAAWAASASLGGQAGQQPAALPSLDLTVGASTRLLVVAPHPDDETLGAGGLIRRVTAHGGAVQLVWLTSGDGFPEGVETADGIAHPTAGDYRSYGGVREFEARAAAAALGVEPGALSFLGFPDEGMCLLASTYLSAKSKAFKSPYTDRVSPPLTEQMIRGTSYRGTDVHRELERLIGTFAPTVIALPAPEDAHPDHCATHIFVREALSSLSSRGRPMPRVLHYLVHYRQWPLTPDAGTGRELRPPAGFPPSERRWARLALTGDEATAKADALLKYRTQMLVIGRFMLAFGRSNELFLEGEPASLPACWCDGRNVATELPAEKYRRPPARR